MIGNFYYLIIITYISADGRGLSLLRQKCYVPNSKCTAESVLNLLAIVSFQASRPWTFNYRPDS